MPGSERRQPPPPIFIVEDDPGLNILIRETLEGEGFACESFSDASTLIARLEEGGDAFLLLDYSLPDMTGADLVETIMERGLDRPFIIITGREDAGIAVTMLKKGARDYLIKGVDFLDTLPATMHRAIQELETETRLQKAIDALRESEARLAKAQNLSRLGSWELDVRSREMSWSTAMYRLLMLEPSERITPSLHLLYSHIHPEDLESFRDAVETLLTARSSFNRDIRMITVTGESIYVNAQGDVEFSDDGAPLRITGTMMDISERKRAEQKIEQLAYFDPLTTLPNRSLFNDRLTQAISQATRDRRRLAILFIDLDRFKTINDTMGHAAGDDLLTAVATILEGCVRESDTVARLGGDEFVILLNSISSSEDASVVAEKINNALASPIRLGDTEVYTSASIGIAIFPDDGTDVTTILKHSDSAMYQAKEQGRNTYQFFSTELNLRVHENLLLETSLRRGIEQNQFSLVYQPQMDVLEGKLVGVEALLRWHHPEMGILFPDRFIPIAEETGMIVPLGAWVVETACRQGVEWIREGLPHLRIAVNVSARQFRAPDIVATFSEILHRTGFPPSSLEIELTESTIMSYPDKSREILLGMKKLGISIAIDDFGTGYSSLACLKLFPIDRLKIDRTFVCDITNDPNGAVIVDAIIAMAHSLRLKVTAEGVELPEHFDYLSTRNCDELQGFYLGSPLTPEEFARFITTRPPSSQG
ncbi:MAG: EAL domain-containing protein [Desulfuromonadia bacterium]